MPLRGRGMGYGDLLGQFMQRARMLQTRIYDREDVLVVTVRTEYLKPAGEQALHGIDDDVPGRPLTDARQCEHHAGQPLLLSWRLGAFGSPRRARRGPPQEPRHGIHVV